MAQSQHTHTHTHIQNGKTQKNDKTKTGTKNTKKNVISKKNKRTKKKRDDDCIMYNWWLYNGAWHKLHMCGLNEGNSYATLTAVSNSPFSSVHKQCVHGPFNFGDSMWRGFRFPTEHTSYTISFDIYVVGSIPKTNDQWFWFYSYIEPYTQNKTTELSTYVKLTQDSSTTNVGEMFCDESLGWLNAEYEDLVNADTTIQCYVNTFCFFFSLFAKIGLRFIVMSGYK